jgi:hypothetical protein
MENLDFLLAIENALATVLKDGGENLMQMSA